MAIEERIVEVETPAGNTHTTHTVVDREPRSGGGMGLMFGILLLVALAVGGYFLMQGTNASTSKDNAIAAAADDVGTAAEKVGDAAQDAAKKIGN